MTHPLGTATSRERWKPLAVRLAVLSLLWAVLVEAEPKGLWVGLLAVPLALGASVALSPPGPRWVRPLPLARLLPGFLWQSLVGSFDVARRAFQPRLSLAPALVELPLGLPSLPARLFLSSVTSLIPGTLGVAVTEQGLRLHLLDVSGAGLAGTLEALRALERRVAPIFGHAPQPGERP